MLPGAHLVTFFITQPLPSVLPASHSWSNFYCGSTNRIRKNVSEFWVGMKYSIITYGSLSCVPREGLLPASFFQHLSVIGPPHYKKCLAIPCLTPPKPKKEKKLHKRTIISVTYCLSRAWKLACLPACLLPGAHLVTFFYHPTTAQRSPCRPQLVQFLLWKYKQDKKKCKWVPGRHEILHYHIWFPGLCATGGFASSILWPTTLQTPCLTPPKLKKKKDFTKGP